MRHLLRSVLAVSFLALAVPASAQVIQYNDTITNASGKTVTGPQSVDASHPLPVSGTFTAGGVAQGSTTAGQTGTLSQCATTTAAPSYTNGTTNPCSTTTSGDTRVYDAQAHTDAQSAVPAGTNIIGKVGIDQTTDGTTNAVHLVAGTAIAGKVGIDQTTPGTTNAVQLIPGTSGGLTFSTIEPAASDNHTNLKNGAGQVYEITAFNNSATINYLRLYNAASGFNGCNSATNLIAVFHIPANTSDAGFIYRSDVGIPFSTGISYCVVSAYGQATTTSATASAIDINIGYK